MDAKFDRRFLTLQHLEIVKAKSGLFNEWLKSKGKLIILQFAGCFGGGQGKRSYGFLCIKRNQCKI